MKKQQQKKAKKKKNDFLEHIPRRQLSCDQITAFPAILYNDSLPVYRLKKEPTHLEELDLGGNFAILRDNDTAICLYDYDSNPFEGIHVSFRIIQGGKYPTINGIIYGEEDDIAETATFFWSLKQADGINDSLQIDYLASEYDDFDLRCIEPDWLIRILDANPTRHFEFQAGTWNAEQSVVLATRPYPLNLTLSGYHPRRVEFRFQDEGTAFMDALQNRQSSFGSLGIDGEHLSAANLPRLFILDTLEKLTISPLFEESKRFLPFSAKAKALEYKIHAEYIQPNKFDSLDILTKDLTLDIDLDDAEEWAEVLVSFFHRVAELDHLERFCFSADWDNDSAKKIQLEDITRVARVADAMIGAINSSPNLIYLNLSKMDWLVKCVPQLQRLFHAMEGHAALRRLIVKSYPAEDPAFSWLARLLSRNRDIVVLDSSGKRISNGTTIDKLYVLNRFYNGSVALVKEVSTSLRPLLVATTLTECASRSFQYTSLLLSHHTDVLCEFMDGLDLDDMDTAGPVVEETVARVSDEPHQATASSKRRKMQ